VGIGGNAGLVGQRAAERGGTAPWWNGRQRWIRAAGRLGLGGDADRWPGSPDEALLA
jgi:hypothetical protein